MCKVGQSEEKEGVRERGIPERILSRSPHFGTLLELCCGWYRTITISFLSSTLGSYLDSFVASGVLWSIVRYGLKLAGQLLMLCCQEEPSLDRIWDASSPQIFKILNGRRWSLMERWNGLAGKPLMLAMAPGGLGVVVVGGNGLPRHQRTRSWSADPYTG